MPERKDFQLLARTAATTQMALRRIWVNNGAATGVEIGVMLTEVFYTANPWVTAQYLAGRLGGAYSDDTIRRRLEEMVDDGRVEVVEAGGRKLYRARENEAQATVDAMLEGLAIVAPIVTTD